MRSLRSRARHWSFGTTAGGSGTGARPSPQTESSRSGASSTRRASNARQSLARQIPRATIRAAIPEEHMRTCRRILVLWPSTALLALLFHGGCGKTPVTAIGVLQIFPYDHI